MALSVAALSVPWQLAWTMTLREKPSRSRSANSISGPASSGRYLALALNGNCACGPKTWQCASTAPTGGVNRGCDGLARQDTIRSELILFPHLLRAFVRIYF